MTERKEPESKKARIQRKVERMGVFFEQAGLTPMTGRVFAYLLLAEPPHKDFYEIQEFMNASKSSISTALKFLQNDGVVEYITFSGDRRRYFRINPDRWYVRLKERFRQLTEMQALIASVLEERQSGKYDDFNAELHRLEAFHAYLADGIEQLIEKWEQAKP